MATIPLPKAKKSLAERAAESLRKANFTDEEKRMLVEGTDAHGTPLSESKKMELSKMYTARTSGLDWRQKAAERLKAEEPARAQQALEERAAANRRMREESQPAFLPEKADVWTKSPTGGEIKVGAETLKRAQELRAKREEEKAAKDSEYRKKLYAIKQEGKDALKKKYEEGLAAKGFAPPKTREEQAAIDRARMEDFQAISAAKESAREASQNAARDSRKYKILQNRALREGRVDLFNEFKNLSDQATGSIKDTSARNKFFEAREMAKAKELIKQRDAARRESMQKQSTSTPEATISGYKESASGVTQNPLSLLPPPLYQVFAGKYGKGTSGRYVKPEGPTVRSSKQKSKAKVEAEVKQKSTPLSESIKQFERQEAAAGAESNNKKIQEAKREIAELSKTTTKPIGSELPERKKTLRELRRDESKIIELQKIIESLNKKS